SPSGRSTAATLTSPPVLSPSPNASRGRPWGWQNPLSALAGRGGTPALRQPGVLSTAAANHGRKMRSILRKTCNYAGGVSNYLIAKTTNIYNYYRRSPPGPPRRRGPARVSGQEPQEARFTDTRLTCLGPGRRMEGRRARPIRAAVA